MHLQAAGARHRAQPDHEESPWERLKTEELQSMRVARPETPRSEAGSGDGKLFRSPPTVSGIILNFKPDPKRGTCTQLHLHEINHVSLGEIFTAWDRHPGPCRALEDGGDLGDGPVLCKSSSRSSDATPLAWVKTASLGQHPVSPGQEGGFCLALAPS